MSGFLCSMVGASFTVAAAAEVLRSKKGITAVGNAEVDTAQSKFGGSSALFDGTGGATGDYLNVAHTSDLDLTTSDITVEAWVRLSSTGFERHILSKGGVTNVNYGQYNLYLNSSNQPVFLVKPSSVAIATSSVSLSANVWYHLAGVKSGTSVKIYVDGTERGSATATGNLTSNSGALTIGYEANTDSKWWAGHLDEIRISNSARYTTTFTPSTTPFVNDANTLFLMHANGTDASTFFEDDNGVRSSTSLIATGAAKVSTTQSKFGGSSANFDGSSNTQVLVRSWDTSSYTGDFTIEGWFYITDKTTSSNARVWSDGDGATTEDFRLLQFEYSTNQIYMVTGQSGNDSWNYSYVSATLNINTWYHIAASRSGSSLRIFVNGTQQGSTISNSLAFTSASSNHSGRLGMFRTDASRYRGFIDDFRISNSARYTTTFTPSTTAFVNDSNTLLLIHADGTNNSTVFRDDNGARAQKGISALGNAQVDTAQSKFGGASALFDGTGDYLQLDAYTDLNFGTNNFTVEFWINFTNKNNAGMFSNGTATYTTDSIVFGNDGGTTSFGFFHNPGGRLCHIAQSDFNTGTWYHIAATRSGNTFTMYLDGVAKGSSTYSGTINFNANNATRIGMATWESPTGFTGYIDEFRISSSARYTANFTPSTTPFQSDANTVLLLHMDGTDGSTVFFDDNGIAPYTP